MSGEEIKNVRSRLNFFSSYRLNANLGAHNEGYAPNLEEVYENGIERNSSVNTNYILNLKYRKAPLCMIGLNFRAPIAHVSDRPINTILTLRFS